MVFIPETIGSLVYLSRNLASMKKRVIAGFNLTCLGDERAYSYLPSRNGDTYSDGVAKHVLRWTDPNYVKHSWLDRGSDERQYCAPGVDCQSRQYIGLNSTSIQNITHHLIGWGMSSHLMV